MKPMMSLVVVVVATISAVHSRTIVSIPLTANRWEILYSSGVQKHPRRLQGLSGWYIDLPDERGSLNYVVTDHDQSLLTALAISFTAETVVTSGLPLFNYQLQPDNTCTFPAHARAYIEQNLSSEFGRWWSNPIAYALDSFTVQTVTTTFAASQWSSVNGLFGDSNELATAGFADALEHHSRIGLTFGGGCFFGHGVNVLNGTARFILTNYQVAVP